MSESLLERIERFYDAVPRAWATVEEIGSFTLFVKAGDEGWPFYARPRLGYVDGFSADDVHRVLERQRALGAPTSFEWVEETTPGLTEVAQAAGLLVGRYPLMAMSAELESPTADPDLRVDVLGPDDSRVAEVEAAIGAAFQGTDEIGELGSTAELSARLRARTFRMVGAFDRSRAVGGGFHQPRGDVTELVGVGVLPSLRRKGLGTAITAELVADARALGVETVFLSAGTQRVADIYSRVGFRVVATACIAEAAS